MHPCGHSSVKFLWSCDARAHDSFSLFKSTQCFQNMFFYQIVHSFESILGVRENFHSIHPLGVYIFFKNWLWSLKIFAKKSWKLSPFKSTLVFLARQLFYYYFLFFFLFLFFFFLFLFPFLSYYHLFISSPFFFFFSLKRSCRQGRTLPTYV